VLAPALAAEAAAQTPAPPPPAAAPVSEYGSSLIASSTDPPTSEAFKLASRPESLNKIWLDFRGANYTNTGWNSGYNKTTIVVPAYSVDATATFSTYERQM
jgi:hypothetical protein